MYIKNYFYNQEDLVLGFNKGSEGGKQVTMEAQGGGSSTPSYSNVVLNKGRAGKKNKPPHSSEDTTKKTETRKAEGSNTHAEQGTHKEDR